MAYDPNARTIRWLETLAWDRDQPMTLRANAVRRILHLTTTEEVPTFEDDLAPVETLTDEELVRLAMNELACRVEQAERAAGWDSTP